MRIEENRNPLCRAYFADSSLLICLRSRAMSTSCFLRSLASVASCGMSPSTADVNVACAALSAGGTRIPNQCRGVAHMLRASEEAWSVAGESVAVVGAGAKGAFSALARRAPASTAPGTTKSGAQTEKATWVSSTTSELFLSTERPGNEAAYPQE